MHVHNVSIWQVDEHPSFELVFLSSHCSLETITPSPQTDRQVPEITENPFWLQDVQLLELVHVLHPEGQATHPLELSKKKPASHVRGARVTFSQTPLGFK